MLVEKESVVQEHQEIPVMWVMQEEQVIRVM
jgi:hypothetical protein